MPTDVVMPALGMNQDTGRLVEWFKREGDAVARGEPLMQVETDKATVEIEAPASGVLAAVTARPGDDVPVGQSIAVILAPGEEASPAPPAEAGPATAPRAAPASPLARRLAGERGIDVASIAGSGPGGAVKAGDLPAASAEPARAPSRTWATMARRTAESWTAAPHFYLEREVDASRLQSWRAHARRTNPAVTVTDLLIRLVASCLPRHPLVNGRWDGERTVAVAEVGVGIAVAVEEGLVVPVIAGADRLTLAEITARRADLTERARAGRLRPDDLSGATFTISNLGMYAVDGFHAIVDSPQAAILAVGRIADRVVAVDGAARVRPSLRLSLSCDHRAVDGARAADFLTELGDLVEEPAGLL
jgi:pyruvate dehydrogenase E2 component (dihydrolipoamide acetyltransferase)